MNYLGGASKESSAAITTEELIKAKKSTNIGYIDSPKIQLEGNPEKKLEIKNNLQDIFAQEKKEAP